MKNKNNSIKTIIERVLPSFDVYVCGSTVYFTMFQGDCGSDRKNLVFNGRDREVYFTPMLLIDFLNAFRCFAKSYFDENSVRLAQEINACKDVDEIIEIVDFAYGNCFFKFTESVSAIKIENFFGKYEQAFMLAGYNVVKPKNENENE